MLRQMKGDAMLVMIAAVPFLMGILFRFGIPLAEKLLMDHFGLQEILAPYYALFDMFLVIMTPSMFSYAAAMVMLDESDDHIVAYLSVTPLGKAGYLFSRLGLTGLIAFVVGVGAGLLFQLSDMGLLLLVGTAFAGTLQSIITAMLIVAFSKNKVEGMAVGKLTSLLSMAALAPFFVGGNAQFIALVFPSFWIGKSVRSGGYYPLIISVLSSFLWIVLLYNKFIRKITR